MLRAPGAAASAAEAAARNSGRTDLLAAGGLLWRPVPDWQLHGQVRFPFTLQAEGGQLDAGPVLGLGVSWTVRAWGEDGGAS